VNEYVLTGFLGNESKPLLVVEPLHFAAGHISLLMRREKRVLPPPGKRFRSSACVNREVATVSLQRADIKNE
jgi:hypothetical protein